MRNKAEAHSSIEESARKEQAMKYSVLFLIAANIGAAQPPAARDLNERGLAVYSRGDYGGAEQLYRESITKWMALGESFTPHLAITRMNLGEALSAQGKRGEAALELRQSLALFRRSFGIRDVRTLACVNLLAGVDLMLNNYEEAGRLYGEALPIERELYPAEVELARTLGGLSHLELLNGHPDLALPLAEEALSLAIRVTGPESIDTAFAYSNVGEVHRASGHPERALPLYRRARDIYEKLLGPAHPRVASMLSQEALILAGDGELATAAQQLNGALAILEKSCPGCLCERWTAEGYLAAVRMRQGKYAEADRLLSDVLTLQQSSNPQPSYEIAGTLKALDTLHQRAHRTGEADRMKRATPFR